MKLILNYVAGNFFVSGTSLNKGRTTWDRSLNILLILMVNVLEALQKREELEMRYSLMRFDLLQI